MKAEVFLDEYFMLGEGPAWDERTSSLYWVDITNACVHRIDLHSGNRIKWTLGQFVGAMAPCEKGGFLAAITTGIYHMGEGGEYHCIARPDPLNPLTRFNDGKCDPLGRFWAGTMNLFPGVRNAGALYRLDPSGRLHTVLTGVSCSNGLAFLPNLKTLYFNDTPTGCVRAFDLNDEGFPIDAGRVAVETGGKPDGMTIDEEGMLWVALWGSSCVNRYNPKNGKLLQTVDIPARFSSSCCFGGEDMCTLFITSAGEEDDSPLAGRIFAAHVDVPGAKTYRFDG